MDLKSETSGYSRSFHHIAVVPIPLSRRAAISINGACGLTRGSSSVVKTAMYPSSTTPSGVFDDSKADSLRLDQAAYRNTAHARTSQLALCLVRSQLLHSTSLMLPFQSDHLW